MVSILVEDDEPQDQVLANVRALGYNAYPLVEPQLPVAEPIDRSGDPLKILLVGSPHFGSQVLSQSRTRLQDAAQFVGIICSPVPDNPLEALGSRLGVERFPYRTLLNPADLPPFDLLIEANSQLFIPNAVLEAARIGAIGYHASLLPRHRGRDPLRWAVHMGDPVIGGTVMWLTDDIDAGPIISQRWCFATRSENAEQLWRQKLSPLGVEMLVDTTALVASGEKVRSIPQDEQYATWEPAWERPSFHDLLREGMESPQLADPSLPPLDTEGEEEVETEWLDESGCMTWQLLDAILRHYQEFRALREAEGIDEIAILGYRINLNDLLQGIDELPPRQRQAVFLTCIEDMREIDAAQIMLPGSRSGAPIGTYKRKALSKIVQTYY